MRREPLFFLLGGMLSIAAFAAAIHVKVTGTPGSPDTFAEGFAQRSRNKINLQFRGFQPPFVMHYGNEKIIQLNVKRNSILMNSIPNSARIPEYKDQEFEENDRTIKGFNGGKEFLKRLLYYPGKECIPKLTIVGHGWGNSKPMGGEGIPILLGEGAHVWPATGIYLDDKYRQKVLAESLQKYVAKNGDSSPGAKAYIEKAKKQSKEMGATFDDLASMIENGTLADGSDFGIKKKVKFCKESGCTIQLYACNIGDEVAQKLLKVSGCQVVYGSGNLTGGKGLTDNSGNFDHYWWGDSKDGTLRPDSGMIKRITPSNSEAGFNLDHMISDNYVYDSVNMRSVPKAEMVPYNGK